MKFLLCKVSAWVEKQKRVPNACVQGCEHPRYAFAMKSRTTRCAKEEVKWVLQVRNVAHKISMDISLAPILPRRVFCC